jgi:hypothetical protein
MPGNGMVQAQNSSNLISALINLLLAPLSAPQAHAKLCLPQVLQLTKKSKKTTKPLSKARRDRRENFLNAALQERKFHLAM